MSGTDTPSQDAQRPVDVRIVGGGTPSPEQLAAIAVALTPVTVVVDGAGQTGQPSGWRKAAFIEGIGGRPAAGLADLVQGRFGLGYVGDQRAG